METQAAENLENARKGNKAYFDQHKRLRGSPLQLGDLVLLFNSRKQTSRTCANKLDDNWFGLYRIREIPENLTYYLLEELDGVPLASSIAGNRVKKFFSRVILDEDRRERHETIRIRDSLEPEGDTDGGNGRDEDAAIDSREDLDSDWVLLDG